MQILLYGESSVNGSGAYFYANSITEHGHTLLTYDDHTYLEHYKTNLFFKIIRKINGRNILSIDQRRHFNGLLNLVIEKKPDIIIILKGLYLSFDNVQELKKHCRFVVAVNHDDYFSLNKNNVTKGQFLSIPAYDFVFVTREINVEEVRPFNRNVELFLFSFEPSVHRKVSLNEEDYFKYKTDVLFIGTYERNRAKMLEKLIKNAKFSLSIYGYQWNKLKNNSILKAYVKSNNGLWMEEMAKAIQASRITLGFLRKENRDQYTQRTFEIPACGGLLLGERTAFQERILSENIDAFYFDVNDIIELRNQIDYILAHPTLADNVRENGTKKIQTGGFTYKDRIQQIIDKYNQLRRFE